MPSGGKVCRVSIAGEAALAVDRQRVAARGCLNRVSRGSLLPGGTEAIPWWTALPIQAGALRVDPTVLVGLLIADSTLADRGTRPLRVSCRLSRCW